MSAPAHPATPPAQAANSPIRSSPPVTPPPSHIANLEQHFTVLRTGVRRVCQTDGVGLPRPCEETPRLTTSAKRRTRRTPTAQPTARADLVGYPPGDAAGTGTQLQVRDGSPSTLDTSVGGRPALRDPCRRQPVRGRLRCSHRRHRLPYQPERGGPDRRRPAHVARARHRNRSPTPSPLRNWRSAPVGSGQICAEFGRADDGHVMAASGRSSSGGVYQRASNRRPGHIRRRLGAGCPGGRQAGRAGRLPGPAPPTGSTSPVPVLSCPCTGRAPTVPRRFHLAVVRAR
jgi:hypothetical protein